MKNNFLVKLILVWGFFWGILGLISYYLGLVGLWYQFILIILFCVALIILGIYLKKNHCLGVKKFLYRFWNIIYHDWFLFLLIIIFIILALFNLVGVIAPEIEFDALWYHLTLPKIYLMVHNVHYLPRGPGDYHFYYSVTPRLTEMLYGIGLAFDGSGIFAKLIHYSFGLFWFLSIFVFLRLFLTRRWSFLLALAIYGSSSALWLSQTANIDLATAFFVSVSLWSLFSYFKKSDEIFLYFSAIFMGFNLATKTYGLIIFSVIFLIILFRVGWREAIKYALIALVIVLPFYLQAYFATGNPIYPVFSIQDSALGQYIYPAQSLKEWYLTVWLGKLPGLFWRILVNQYTPVFGLILLSFLLLFKNIKDFFWPLLIFLGFFLGWSLIPITEPRYFIVILPIMALLAGLVIEKMNFKFFKVSVVLLLLIGLGINLNLQNTKFLRKIKVVFHQETKETYLRENLGPLTFYDFAGSFKKHLPPDAKILTANIHNLFYVNFNFWDLSFIPEIDDMHIRPAELAEILKNKGFTRILVGNNKGVFAAEDFSLYFDLVYQENNFRLYQIKND